MDFFTPIKLAFIELLVVVAFVFGIIIVNTIKEKGVITKKQLMIICAKATVIVAAILALIYTDLSYMGASSVEKLVRLDNDAKVLAKVSDYYFGS